MGRRGLRAVWRGSRVGALALALMLAACGSRPVAVPQLVAPAAPQGFDVVTYRAAGLRLAAPRSWNTTPQSLPFVTVISSGGAVISLWRYGRPGTLPASASRLQRAYRRLIAAALRRQPKLHVLGASLSTVDSHPAVLLQATEPIGSSEQRVSSLHVFTPTSEVVLEEYAPLKLFDRVQRQVFEHVSRSLVVLKP